MMVNTLKGVYYSGQSYKTGRGREGLFVGHDVSVVRGKPILGLRLGMTVRIRGIRVLRCSVGGILLRTIDDPCWPTTFGFQ